jgi:hypothetical protein
MSEDRKFIVTYVDGAAVTTIRVGDTITFGEGFFEPEPEPTRGRRIKASFGEIAYRIRAAVNVLVHGD